MKYNINYNMNEINLILDECGYRIENVLYTKKYFFRDYKNKIAFNNFHFYRNNIVLVIKMCTL